MLQPPSKRFLQIAFLGWNTKYLFPNVMKQNKSHSIDTSNMWYRRPWVQTKQSCRYPGAITLPSLAPLLRLQDENLLLVNKKLSLPPPCRKGEIKSAADKFLEFKTRKWFTLPPDLFDEQRRWGRGRAKPFCKVVSLEPLQAHALEQDLSARSSINIPSAGPCVPEGSRWCFPARPCIFTSIGVLESGKGHFSSSSWYLKKAFFFFFEVCKERVRV